MTTALDADELTGAEALFQLFQVCGEGVHSRCHCPMPDSSATPHTNVLMRVCAAAPRWCRAGRMRRGYTHYAQPTPLAFAFGTPAGALLPDTNAPLPRPNPRFFFFFFFFFFALIFFFFFFFFFFVSLF